MLFHTFWNDVHLLNHPILQLHIQSFLYTQNRRCSHLIVWTLPPFDIRVKNAYNMIYAPYVEFRSLIEVAYKMRQVGTYVDAHWYELPLKLIFNRRPQLSDAARFIILHRLGGLYVDVDTIYLRDMQPFFKHEFAYHWSILDAFNTAVLRLFPQSNVSSIIIDRARRTRSAWTFLPSSLHTYSLPTDFHRFPCAFFDPVWLTVDGGDPETNKQWKLSEGLFEGFKDSFIQRSKISHQGLTAFDGAFTFHWHSSSSGVMYEPGSYVDQWKQFFDTQVYDQSHKTLVSI
ncbi:unnamed protein product [Rotaria socialis]|uniref:Uncharacterized protein n=2 Tax=Rotaria socialis TaxID=392032 RepID=A0A817RSA0_9BILA|nr:unnamed protein product [Rotaria socialis]